MKTYENKKISRCDNLLSIHTVLHILQRCSHSCTIALFLISNKSIAYCHHIMPFKWKGNPIRNATSLSLSIKIYIFTPLFVWREINLIIIDKLSSRKFHCYISIFEFGFSCFIDKSIRSKETERRQQPFQSEQPRSTDRSIRFVRL